jgi:hypothetical protein
MGTALARARANSAPNSDYLGRSRLSVVLCDFNEPIMQHGGGERKHHRERPLNLVSHGGQRIPTAKNFSSLEPRRLMCKALEYSIAFRSYQLLV